jgi:hypothetical protein
VSPTGRKVVLEALSTHGLEPAEQCNGYPVFNHRYTPEEVLAAKTGRTEAVYRQRDGSYKMSSTPVWFGNAHYFRNYAD